MSASPGNLQHFSSKTFYFPFWIIGLSFVWGCILYFIASNNITNYNDTNLEAIKLFSRTTLQQNLMYRKWNAGHGGVYVPITDTTNPNPYLSAIPNRDIETTDGRKLTLINPAYMTRQVAEKFEKEYNVRIHLTSLKPIRPENFADEWETNALIQFEKGIAEVSELFMSGEPEYAFYKLILPLKTEEPCLKCHAAQGYKLGDLRGGLSIRLPTGTFAQAYRKFITEQVIFFGILWFLGVAGVFYTLTKIKTSIVTIEQEKNKAEGGRELLVRFINASGDAICFKDANGRWIEANEVLLSVMGLQGIDYKGKTDCELAEFVSEPYRHMFHSCLKTDEEAWAEQTTVRAIETIILPVTNKKYMIDIAKSPLFEADGTRKGLVVIGRDLTSQIELEKVVEERERFLKSVYNGIQDGIIVLDNEMRILNMNAAGARLCGNRQTFGKKCYELLGEHPNRICDNCPAHIAMHTLSPSETMRKVLIGDEEKYFEIKAFPLWSADKQLSGAIEFVRDVTEKVLASLEQKKLVMAVEQSGEAILIADRAGLIDYVNSAFERVTGYPQTDIIGKRVEIILQVDDAAKEKLSQDVIKTILAGKIWTGEFEGKKRDGSPFAVDCVISPLLDVNGRIEHFVGKMRDVTNEKRLQKQLIHAQKVESIGILAGGVAHDFNNVLTAIDGYAQLALNRVAKQKDELALKFLQEVLKATERATSIVRQLLLFSRRKEIQVKRINLNRILKDFAKMLGRLLGEDIRFVTRLYDDLWDIAGDAGCIEQVIMNLAINAKDAMQPGCDLTISTINKVIDEDYALLHDYARQGEFVCLSVTDTGTGIESATLAKIFDPFFTTKPEGKGTGLGLAVTFGIVEQHGGWIDVSTEVGKGTTFHVFFPAVKRLEDVSEATNSRIASDFDAAGKTIVLVEDDLSVMGILNEMLRSTGFNVEVFTTAEAALERVKQDDKPIDIVISDIVLPNMQGTELAEEILRLHPTMPIILGSGYMFELAQKDSLGAKGIMFLEKPYSPAKLLDTIRTRLQSSVR